MWGRNYGITERLGKFSPAAGNSQPESDAEFINHVKSFGALEKALKCSNHYITQLKSLSDEQIQSKHYQAFKLHHMFQK